MTDVGGGRLEGRRRRTSGRRAPFAARVAWLAAALLSAACSSLGGEDLPKEAPPLRDMEEPAALHEEPDDEEARTALPLGSFTGVAVVEARRTLDDGAPPSGGVRVARVVENSPGDAAGIEEDDLLLEVTTGDGPARELRWPSEWRQAEIDAPEGATMTVLVDRAGEERTMTLRTVARVRPTERTPGDRYREESRIGVVLRTATEVEARGAGLGPGGGAVVVGLAAASPWRAAGMRYGDLLTAVGGRPVAHPQQVLEAVRSAEPGDTLRVRFVRRGIDRAADLAVSRREQEVRSVSVPVLFSYESARGRSETSVLLGLFHSESTEVAWKWRILWLFSFSGGDSDRLLELEE